MTTYIKVMSDDERVPDNSPYKGYTIHTIEDGDTFTFRDQNGGELEIHRKTPFSSLDEQRYDFFSVPGNAYVMNDAGKTIATYMFKKNIRVVAPDTF